MKKKRTKKEITNREMWLGILIAIFGAVVDFCFFGFSYSADPQGEHGEITTASIVLSVIWIALSLAGAFLMSYFLNDRSFLFGFSGYLILSLVVVYPLLYGYCASLYPAYGLIAEKLFRSKTMLENMPDSSSRCAYCLSIFYIFSDGILPKSAPPEHKKSRQFCMKTGLPDFLFYL